MKFYCEKNVCHIWSFISGSVYKKDAQMMEKFGRKIRESSRFDT
jgi:hypothetical protein